MDKKELREKALERTREKVGETDKIQLMVKAVKSLDQIKNSQANEIEAFRDWYSLHFPELEKEIEDDEHLIKILSKNTVERNNLEPFQEMAENSTGMHITEKDAEILENFVQSLKNQQDTIESLEDYIENIAKNKMSNTSILLGPILAARIVNLAGGLEDLAKKPASTVQVLGAEKALFRHLRKGGNPPKHGILFEHDLVSPLPSKQRGKMARFLANKTVMAARIDQYGNKNKGEELREECQQKFEELEKEV
jgi:nucleolar protein 56